MSHFEIVNPEYINETNVTPSMEGHSERRVFPRYPCTGTAEIFQSGQLRWGKISDISRSGCYIETEHPLPVGTEAQLRLFIADVLLDIGARAASATPLVGMGMEFMAVAQQQENNLGQIMGKVQPSPALQQAECSKPNTVTFQMTREAAPDILDKIIARVNEKGVLTRQEILDIMKGSK